MPPIPVAHHGGAVGAPLHRRGHATSWPPSWSCWSRIQRTADSTALGGYALHFDRRPARPGRPLSTTGSVESAATTGRTGPQKLCGPRRQRAGFRAAGHRQDTRHVGRRAQAAEIEAPRALRPGLPAGAGDPRRQSGSGSGWSSAEVLKSRLHSPMRHRGSARMLDAGQRLTFGKSPPLSPAEIYSGRTTGIWGYFRWKTPLFWSTAIQDVSLEKRLST